MGSKSFLPSYYAFLRDRSMYSGINTHWHPRGTKNDASFLPKQGLVLVVG